MHQTWAEGLRAVINTNGKGKKDQATGDSDGDEMHMLQARSRQLQNRIGGLEAINERRDTQVNKLVKRLDGAMQMLSAVQEMCNQQGKVISAQKVAIRELQRDIGLKGE